MKKFNWSNFSAEFLKEILYSKHTSEHLRPAHNTDDTVLLTPYLEGVAKYPDKYFVEKYRDEIECFLLKEDSKLLVIAYNHCTGQKKNPAKTSTSEMRIIFEELRRKPFSQSLVGAYQKVLLMLGEERDEDEFYTRFYAPIAIDLKSAVVPDVPLYPFQDDAVVKLEEVFVSEDRNAGMLVMPTGSGKTRTSVYFLLSKMIKEGYQIVWLTHRHMLIEQPADEIYNFSGLVKREDPSAKALRMLCVSGNHASIRRADKKDDILVLSVQSTVRSLDFLKRVLRKKVMIVVDEAHHAIAASYRKIIDCIRKSSYRKTKLLGLTATPVRMSERGTAQLTNLFENNIIFSISTATLISLGILAEPIFEQVQTDYEIIPTIDEKKFIQKYGEIDPSLIDKIARSSERNKTIVERYMDNRTRYGKTLVFALNIHHCVTLCQDFKARGIRCDYVYSGKSDNAKVIERFRRNELDVLININILTEGSDVPDIQTVFLTRPTASEVLLMQMIGRGLRGTGAKGTENAYIVDFHDKWDTFVRWLTPEFVLADEYEPDIEEKPPAEYEKKDYYPISLITDVYNSITYDHAGIPAYNTVLPYGWFSTVDEEGNDLTVLVTESQVDGYSAMENDIERLLKDKNLTGGSLQKYFTGFATPPLDSQLQAYLDDLRMDGVPPTIYPFAAKKDFDPYYISQKIKDENLAYNQIQELMEKAYVENSLAQMLFLDMDSYKQRVLAYLGNNEMPNGTKVEELPLDKIPFDRTPHHDLEQLYKEVNDEMFGECDGIGSVSWTDKCYKSYFGKYIFESGETRINKILDSKDVPAEVIKYLLYHELLHRDFPRHGKDFREREHMYPNYEEWDSFLDGQMFKFDLGGIWQW